METNDKELTGELFPPEEMTAQEQPQVEDNGARWQRVFELLIKLEGIHDATGIYSALPTFELMPRIKAYYDRHIDAVLDALKGLPEDTRKIVAFDYCGALVGCMYSGATLEQMRETLATVKAHRAFMIDRYGFYWCLLSRYDDALAVYDDLRKNVIGTANHTPTVDEKDAFLENALNEYGADKLAGIEYLKDDGLITPADFIGCDVSQVAELMEKARAVVEVSGYGNLYFLARTAYAATEEELNAIEPPSSIAEAKPQEWAHDYAKTIETHLFYLADKMAELYDAETEAEREKAKAEEEKAKVLTLRETPCIICSRPVEISPHGSEIIDVVTIQPYIDEIMEKQPKYGQITTLTVQRVLEFLGVLPEFKKPDNKYDGQYFYSITREELAKFCGYKEAAQEQRLALLGALIMLNNLYFVVDRPERTIKYTTTTGKERKRKAGGRTAVKLVNVSAFDLDDNNGDGRIKLILQPEAFKGKPTYISAWNFRQLREAATNNNSKSRFNYQLMTKYHKAEDDLIAEVYGYDEKRRNAANEDERKKVETQIKKKHSRCRQTVAGWFEEYAQKGWISYEYDTAKKLYSWKRLQIPNGTLPEQDDTPDEQ